MKRIPDPYRDRRFDWKANKRRIEELKKRNFILVPNWFPGGIAQAYYEYEFPNMAEVWMKPRPRFRDWVRFALPDIITFGWKTRLWSKWWLYKTMKRIKQK